MTQQNGRPKSNGRFGTLAFIAGGIGLLYGLHVWDAPRQFLDDRGNPITPTFQTSNQAQPTDAASAIDMDALYQDARLEFKTAELPNGLKIVVVEDHRAPVVTQMVWYNVGAADEDAGASGLAHFLEHLMFKGTSTMKAGEFSDIIAAAGGQENAFTSQDYTAYYQKIAKQHLPQMMALEADRMANLAFAPDEVLPERDVVLEERRQRTDSRPDGRFYEEMSAALYLNHPYGVPVIGWGHELQNLTPESALAFYKRHYGPDNATLIVAGDTNLEEVVRLAKSTYGKLRRANIAPRVRPQEPPQTVSRDLQFSDPRLAQDKVVINWLAPSYVQPMADAPNPYALALLSDVLGGGVTSRIYQALVVEQKLVPSAGAWYSGLAYDYGEFGISVTATAGTNLDVVNAAALDELTKIADQGITADELRRSKLNSLVSQIYAKDNVGHLARMIGASIASGLSYDEVRNWPDRMREVTASDVQAAAQWLQSRARVTAYARKGDAG